MHNDEPALLDALERGPLIEEVGEAIARCTPPQVFGVHGDWGVGKTSFLHQIQRYLAGDCPQQPETVTVEMQKKAKDAEKDASTQRHGVYRDMVQAVWFDAWRYQNEAAPVVALLHESQRYLVLDERNVEDDALPSGNLMTAVVGLEQSRSPEDLVRVVDALRERLRGARDNELRQAFAEWVLRLARRLTPGEEELPPVRTLEDVRMTLEERVAQWPKQWFQEGREEGLEEGLEQGLEHERVLLCRQATSRFGAVTAEHLSGALARIADSNRLADIGDWLVRCDTGEEFLARVDPPADEQDQCDG